ncbi:MAG: membrane protein insertion efficiency factor YidD [Chloroflexi bacterium]|nr:membrane protein insertion efficiency factor YidD [Chloroflexota bacterium]HCU73911.1 membrane protein insertion efficiency factor YidD [Chloroflexota bacterium]
MKVLTLFVIRMYQKWVSPLTGSNCRFHPTCSSYAYGAIDRYGFARGVALTMRRIVRCHPWHAGGFDPVP